MTTYVLLLYEDEYGDHNVTTVHVIDDRGAALAAAREVAAQIAALQAASGRWHKAVEADYHRLKPPTWSEEAHRNDPNTFAGKNVRAWREAAQLHEVPKGTPYTGVDLFEADETDSVRIEF